ncbi:MAG: electron transport complex protein RnfA [Pseudomonadota bacterium]
MREIALILLGTALVNNLVLSQLLGTSALLGMSARVAGAARLAGATGALLLAATLGQYLAQHWLLDPLALAQLRLPVAMLIILLAAALIETGSRRLDALLHRALVELRPLLITNTAVLATALSAAERTTSLAAALFQACAAALGFALVAVLLAGVREHLQAVAVPPAFRGAPVTLISAGLMALAFMGLARMA